MTGEHNNGINVINNASDTLRLVWPQWQGAGESSIRGLLPELPYARARRAYTMGTRVLEAVLPEHAGPTEVVPVPEEPAGQEVVITDGIESKAQVLAGVAAARAAIARHDAPRILTLGGECSVSVVPFTELAARYGQDLAVVWVDSHPDVGTGASQYPGYHAMAVSQIVGTGDAEVMAQLPAVVDASRVALAGLHAWTQDDYPNYRRLGADRLQPPGAARLQWAPAPVAGPNRLQPRGHPPGCGHRRCRRGRSGAGEGHWRAQPGPDQPAAAGPGAGRRRRRTHDRRVHPPASHRPHRPAARTAAAMN